MSCLTLRAAFCATIICAYASPALEAQAPDTFTMEQVIGFPFSSDMAAAPTGSRIAWVVMVKGVRNIYVAEGPSFVARRLTTYTDDDGLELTNLSLSADGRYVVYTRGGDHGSNWPGENGREPNPSSSAKEQHVEIYSVAFDGGAPRKLAEGDNPVVSPRGNRVAYLAGGKVMTIAVDGSDSAKSLISAKGNSGGLEWSPSGDRLAFVSDRGDHSFIGVYSSENEPIVWMAPSTSRDFMPRWSPDGSRIAFVRLAGAGGPPPPILGPHPDAFDIFSPLEGFQLWVADTRTGQGHAVWQSPSGSRGALPTTQGSVNLHWMSGDRLTFLADLDGWEHLYSVPVTGGEPTLLTPGRFMTEYIAPSPDGRFLVYSANTGGMADDLERRHVFSVPVDAPRPVQLTPGSGIEWNPVVTGDARTVAFIGATVQQPMLAATVPVAGGPVTRLAPETVPNDFPASKLVTPRAVVFTAADGIEVHAQLFAAPGNEKRPAVVFVHGGPPRQMLLGWHYMYYYSNSYAVNQYLANHGYLVLSVNYRLGIGYGHEFHHPDNAGITGASEYRDVVAAARYLRTLPQVDQARIGIWGGSYGGFLVAMALAHNSDLFATGVDIHGVHDWIEDWGPDLLRRTHYEQPPDLQKALTVAWQSSPVSAVDTWKSPVLFIHGDDDRNVHFHQTVDLVRRVQARGVRYEELVLPDEIHDFLRHASWLRVDSATVSWFDRMFMKGRAGVSSERK